MTWAKFHQLVKDAQTKGKLKSSEKTQLPFSLEKTQVDVYEIDGFSVTFHDGSYFWMIDPKGNAVKTEDLTDNNFGNLEEMSNEKLALMIEQASKELKQRRANEERKAFDKFMQAWTELKVAFPEVRIRLEVDGKGHYHSMVKDVTISRLN